MGLLLSAKVQDPSLKPFTPRPLSVPADRPYTVGPDTVFVAGNDVLIPLFKLMRGGPSSNQILSSRKS